MTPAVFYEGPSPLVLLDELLVPSPPVTSDLEAKAIKLDSSSML